MKKVLSLALVTFIVIITLVAAIRIANEKKPISTYSPSFLLKGSHEILPSSYELFYQINQEDNVEGYQTELNQYDYEGSTLYLNDGQTVTYDLHILEEGEYEIGFDYITLNDSIVPIEITILINGENQLDRNLIIDKYWVKNDKEKRFDRNNNQVLPQQTHYEAWMTNFFKDLDTLEDENIKFHLDKGINQIEIKAVNETILLGNVYVVKNKMVKTYDEYRNKLPEKNNELITIEAEDVSYKNDVGIIMGVTRDPNVSPSSSNYNLLNHLPDYSFSQHGSEVSYHFEVDHSGYYNISLKYQQRKKVHSNIFLDIKIDNEFPFKELNNYCINPASSWTNTVIGNQFGGYQIYLEEGLHTLTIQNDVSNYQEDYKSLQQISEEINDLTLKIRKITGNQNDPYREWDLEKYIPNIKDILSDWENEIAETIQSIKRMNPQEKSNYEIKNLQSALRKIKELKSDVDKIPNKMTLLSEGSNSIAQTLTLVSNYIIDQPISIDKIYIHGSKAELPKAKHNFLYNTYLKYEGIIATFFKKGEIENQEEINVWVNRPRQIVNIMQQMVDTTFTKETGIKVNLSVMPDEQKLILANAASTQPDVALGISNWIPYELAIRGASVDLRQFEGFGELLNNFQSGAILPYVLDDGVYGLPETQDFQLTLYRKDIMESLNLEIPETYEEIKYILPTLQRYGMNFFLPLSSAGGLKPYAATSPFIYQYSGDFYSSDGLNSTINTEESYKALKMMTDLYTIYSLPQQAPSFYEYFRNGKLPIGVANFSEYKKLLFASPELAGKWNIALHPGVENENGDIDRWATGSAQSVVMFKKSYKQLESWEFIKWWMSKETQVDFMHTLQSVLGSEYLWNTANVEAFKELPIPDEHKEVILQQWQHLREVPRVPGGYMVEREVSNIWNKVVFDGVNLRLAIDDATLTINRELRRKQKEFGYIEGDKVVNKYIVPTIEQVESWKVKPKYNE
ncbi:extracellular solute-binding protein [Mycoplasmatota bacterium]|nr:extracellular solute-binding protein [Mycoplasmatota bacterium]